MSTILTNEQVARLDRSNPEFQRAAPFAEVQVLGQYAPVMLTVAVTADATAGKVVTVPFDMEIVDFVVQARAAQAGETLKLVNGAADITGTVACAVDGVVTRVAAIDDSKAAVTPATTLKIVASHANCRGLVTIIGKRA